MTCREIAEFLMQYRDGELPWAQRAAFKLHLAFCRSCRAYLKTYDLTIQLARLSATPDEEAVPSDVPEELVKAIIASRPCNPDAGSK